MSPKMVMCWSVLKTLQINGFDVSDMMDHVVSVYHQETVCCLFPGPGASTGPPGPPGASSGPRSPLRDYQFMKCDNSEMLRQRPSCCLTMQVSGSSSSGRHPPSSLWILISTIIWQVRHKHTHRESGGVFSPGALSWGLWGWRWRSRRRGGYSWRSRRQQMKEDFSNRQHFVRSVRIWKQAFDPETGPAWAAETSRILLVWKLTQLQRLDVEILLLLYDFLLVPPAIILTGFNLF